MKKLTAAIILMSLILTTAVGCSGKNNEQNPTRVEAPTGQSQDTLPTPKDTSSGTSAGTSADTDSPVTVSPDDTTLVTVPPINDDASTDETFPPPPETSSLPNDTVEPAKLGYRSQFVTSGGTYFVDADYNFGVSTDGGTPKFYTGTVSKMKFCGADYTIVYSTDLNMSLFLDKDDNAVRLFDGRPVSPVDDKLIVYRTSDTFRVVNKKLAYASDTDWRGWNKRDDDCLALFKGKGDICIWDGESIIDEKTFDLIYYFADIYLLVREDGRIRLYNTNFELLADYAEAVQGEKFLFDQTIREGKKRDHFTFFFEKAGSFRYDPPAEEETSAESAE